MRPVLSSVGYSSSTISAGGWNGMPCSRPLPRVNLPTCRYCVPGWSGVGHGHCTPPSFSMRSQVMPPNVGTRRLTSWKTSSGEVNGIG